MHTEAYIIPLSLHEEDSEVHMTTAPEDLLRNNIYTTELNSFHPSWYHQEKARGSRMENMQTLL